MSDAITSALKTLRAKRTHLHDELKRIDQAIDALTALAPKDEGPTRVVLSVNDAPQHPSVRTMLVSLLDESDQDWSASEIIEEYKRRGTPIHGANPDNALRAAMVDATKAGQIERVATGRYKSTKFRAGAAGAEWGRSEPLE